MARRDGRMKGEESHDVKLEPTEHRNSLTSNTASRSVSEPSSNEETEHSVGFRKNEAVSENKTTHKEANKLSPALKLDELVNPATRAPKVPTFQELVDKLHNMKGRGIKKIRDRVSTTKAVQTYGDPIVQEEASDTEKAKIASKVQKIEFTEDYIALPESPTSPNKADDVEQSLQLTRSWNSGNQPSRLTVDEAKQFTQFLTQFDRSRWAAFNIQGLQEMQEMQEGTISPSHTNSQSDEMPSSISCRAFETMFRPEKQCPRDTVRFSNGDQTQARVLCPNCGKSDHKLRACVGPVENEGYVPGCPICDTMNHSLDTCANLTLAENQNVMLRIALCVKRQSRPPFRYAQPPSSIPRTKCQQVCLPMSPRLAQLIQETCPDYWKTYQYCPNPRDEDPGAFFDDLIKQAGSEKTSENKIPKRGRESATEDDQKAKKARISK